MTDYTLNGSTLTTTTTETITIVSRYYCAEINRGVVLVKIKGGFLVSFFDVSNGRDRYQSLNKIPAREARAHYDYSVAHIRSKL